MKLEGEYIFDAPQNIVWEAVQNPDVLGSIVPGGQGVEEVGENQYKTKLKVKVGPVQGKFTGNIKLENIQPPNSYDIIVDGKGAPGFVKATGNLQLSPHGDDKTTLVYSGDAKIGGKIASVGQRLIDASVKSIVAQSLTELNEYVKAQAAKVNAEKAAEEAVAATKAAEEATATAEKEAATKAAEEATAAAEKAAKEVEEYVPPSQSEMAARVASDVASEFISAEYRPYLIGAGVLLVLIILYFFRRSSHRHSDYPAKTMASTA